MRRYASPEALLSRNRSQAGGSKASDDGLDTKMGEEGRKGEEEGSEGGFLSSSEEEDE